MLTPSINRSMRPRAACDVLAFVAATEASGVICAAMTGCENAVEVAILKVSGMGHVWVPSKSVVHCSACPVHVLSAASAVAQTFGIMRFQH